MLRPYHIRPDYLLRAPSQLSLIRKEPQLLQEYAPNVALATPDLAIMEITGPIAAGAEIWEIAYLGYQDHDYIRAGIQTIRQSGAKTALITITSPGGTATGTLETARQLANLKQNGIRTIAWVPVECCSAGYALAAACDMIVAAPSAIVGSIGTILTAIDSSEAYKNEGLLPIIFQRGSLKALGQPGKAWTDEEKAQMETILDDYDQPFKAWITSRRPQLDMTKQQGQWFMGSKAPTGLIDALADTTQDVLTALTTPAL